METNLRLTSVTLQAIAEKSAAERNKWMQSAFYMVVEELFDHETAVAVMNESVRIEEERDL